MFNSPPDHVASPPGSKSARVNWRLLADVIAFATAVISLIVAVLAGTSRDEAKDEAASLTEEIASLDSQISELVKERDQLQDELAEAPASGADEAGTAGDETEGTMTGAYADLEQALETNKCRYGDWEASTLQIAGDQYYDGFQCEIMKAWDPDPTFGYVDLLVPEGTQRLTGIAGIDERSADATVVLKFSVLSVPEAGDPLFSSNIQYGSEGEPFDVPLESVDRVRFQIELVATDYEGDTKPATAGWADVRFE